MKKIIELQEKERLALEELKLRIGKELPVTPCRLTLFGSKARGDAEPDSDIDVLVEMDALHVSPADKLDLRRIAGEISLKFCVLLCLLIVDRNTREEKGDYSIFQNIREEGIDI
jgi:uncharacterized protein